MQIDFPTVALCGLMAAAAVLQVLATLRVKKDLGSSREQKGLQLRLIWLLPLVGAALVLAVLQDDPRPKRLANLEQNARTPAGPAPRGHRGAGRGPTEEP
jgi:hypothetical protein